MARIDGTPLDYYQRELAYLRAAGAAFARAHPAAAARLELGEDEAADPHVERLIESVAFLTGRLQRNLDAQRAEIPAALLGVLYPHLVRPLPSLAVVRCAIDPEQRDLAGGYRVPRGSALYARALSGEECQFRTAADLDLWPLALTEAAALPADAFAFVEREPQVVAVLRLRFTLRGAGSLEALPLRRLRLYLAGHRANAFATYDALFTGCLDVAVRGAPDRAPVRLGRGALRQVGLEPNEALVPWPDEAHDGYRLLQECFAYPDKFRFIEVDGLAGRLHGETFELLLLLDRPLEGAAGLSTHDVALHCVPALNLFPRTSEPIRLDGTHYEYRLVADAHAEASTEVHSIRKVSGSTDPADGASDLAPLYAHDHGQGGRRADAFWLARRDHAVAPGRAGTDVFLSFVDLDLKRARPPLRTAFAHTLCSNRDLAEQLPADAVLSLEAAAPIERVHLLGRPTAAVPPPLDGGVLWRLVSHLSLNHLSLSGAAGLTGLREILRLYAHVDHVGVHQQVGALRSLAASRVQRRLGACAWRGFVEGTRVELGVAPGAFGGASVVLLSSVLDRFFALYAACNSFTELCVHDVERDAPLAVYPPRAGAQALL